MVRVDFPHHLKPVLGERLYREVVGGTLGEIIAEFLREVPALKVHLFEADGQLRPHVLCFVDGVSTRLEQPELPVREKIRFVPAISGG